jgi:cation:H+ antiporter
LSDINSEYTRNAAQASVACCALLLLSGTHLTEIPASSLLWAAPAILGAAMLIAWAAESAQFFIAQGFALAILAWLQTLPEFAVEFVYAWRQQVPYLLANLTGALRLLTGLGWPMIYFVAAICYRRRRQGPLREIVLQEGHCVEVVGLLAPLIYMVFVWAKNSLGLLDAAVLILIYAAYLVVLGKMPPEEAEGIEELERIPRAIVRSPRNRRIVIITGFFALGGWLIYYSAEPFAGSLLTVSAAIGVPGFVFVQWVAPFVSEFPEKVSAFYWARTVHRAPMALMNMVSSNINQWTLLAAMLPIVYSVSRGSASVIRFDEQQSLELLMTLGQSMVGMLFLLNMKLAWWEAGSLFSLWFIQFVFSPVKPGPGFAGFMATHIHWYVTVAYLVWFAGGFLHYLVRDKRIEAFRQFAIMWRQYVWRPLPRG